MGWRELEPQDIGKVIFNRSHKRTDANLVRAGAVIREALSAQELSYVKPICPNMLVELEGRNRPTFILTKP